MPLAVPLLPWPLRTSRRPSAHPASAGEGTARTTVQRVPVLHEPSRRGYRMGPTGASGGRSRACQAGVIWDDGAAIAGATATGIVTVNTVPLPTVLSTVTSPPSRRVSSLTRCNPKPTPPCALVDD